MTDTALSPTPSRPAVRPLRASVGAVATTVASVLPVFLVGGLAVQMGDDLGFSPAGLGLAVSVYFGVSALASLPSGRLVERVGPVVVARVATGLAAGCLLAIAGLARSYPVLVALLALSATANALGQLASNAALARHVPARRQGLSFGVKQAAVPASTLLAGAAVPAVALTAGWRWAFVAAAVAALAALPAVPPGTAAPARERAAERGGGATVALVVVGVAATLAAGAANALGTFVVDSSVHRGLAPGPAGLVLTLGGAVCVAARIGVGWLADRQATGHVTLIAAMLVVGAVGLGLLAVAGPGPLTVGVVLGFGLGWAWPGLLNFAVVRLHPRAPAAATSITQTGVYAGGCVGPLGLGALAGAYGYPAMWLTAAVAMVVAAVLMLTGSRLLTRSAVG
ncbi:MFS transporter [Micromonospora rifamycinica]|uniref:Predicted arabinose efflux permease, MFS family n=1 Tax=Micromonospora rifamycinica TaxID=291594 RepID=A0A109IQH4_9ACTN|nr:MFS transporter [Micromonospora rifamycinica]KWV34709.1 MFS transporter [Micromonospora rifamycinica]SCG68373.1 Predicted arabinose efflux permease, MFS family [Micromonospora rifamycinica]